MLLFLDMHLMTIYLHYIITKNLTNSIYILKLKRLDYLQLTSFKINDDSAKLLNTIINKNCI